MAVQITSAHYKTFEPDANRSESELLADIEGMSSENIMQYLDEEFERHEEVTLKNEVLENPSVIFSIQLGNRVSDELYL